MLLPFCADEGIGDPKELTRRVLDRLTARLLTDGGRRGSQLSPATVASYMRSINVFLGWLRKEGEGADVRAQVPSVPKRIRDTLSREEITRLEDAADLERDKLLVRVLADTGIRLAELLGLRASDLVTSDRGYTLKVRGKGKS